MAHAGSGSVAEVADRLIVQLQRLRRRGSMNYSVNFSELSALLEVVETLAPEFEAAFRHDNVATLEARGGQRVTGVVAARTLRAALEHDADAWFLRVMLAYYLVAELGDARAAAHELAQAAQHRDAPFYVRSLAHRLLAPGVPAPTDDTAGELRLFHQLAQVQARVDAHRARTGALPASVEAALADAEGRALLERIEVDLALTAEGKVVTRESELRSERARERAGTFRKVRPYRLPEY